MNRLEIATRLGAGLLAKLNYVVTAENKAGFAADALALADALIAAHGETDLATRIADDLLTNGFNEKVNRLVMMDDTGKDFGGWSREALIQRISKHLTP